MTLRDQILAAQDIPEELVEVPEWGCTLLMKGMSAGERIAMTQAAYSENGGVDMQLVYPDLVIAAAHDPADGAKVFTQDDRSALLAKSSAAMESLASVAMRLSGIGKDVQDDAGKDSSATPSGDSSTN